MIINEKVINNIKVNFLDLTELAYLYNLFFNKNWNIDIFPASIVKLKRLNILKDETTLTANGENILLDCIEEEKRETIEAPNFDEIWLLFPKDDSNKSFQSTRLIRYNKPETRKQYEIALEEVSHERLMKALKAELSYRKDSGNENKLKYMKSSVNWFKTKAYEEFLDTSDDIEEKYGKQVI